MIKCIETEYKGYRFRSRLEARWAVFFDACGVKWEYEPEGFALGDGIYYLPDFLLHDVWAKESYFGDLWVEVKGEMTELDAVKIREFSKEAPIIVVGNIPDGNDFMDIWFCATCQYDSFDDAEYFNFNTIYGDWYPALPGILPNGHFCILGGDYDADYKATEKAYKIARQARFEHGERPKFIRGGQ